MNFLRILCYPRGLRKRKKNRSGVVKRRVRKARLAEDPAGNSTGGQLQQAPLNLGPLLRVVTLRPRRRPAYLGSTQKEVKDHRSIVSVQLGPSVRKEVGTSMVPANTRDPLASLLTVGMPRGTYILDNLAVTRLLRRV
jgi:hypothetical protein